MAIGLDDIAIGIALQGVGKFKQGMDEVGGKVSSSTSSMGSMLKNFAGTLGIAFGVKEMISFGKAAVDLAAKLEQDTVVFETMLGSAEAAQKQLKTLNDFATRTPFQIDGLIEADKLLINFGRTAEQSISDLKILGDISGGNEERFKSLSLVFGQVASAGRLMGQDLLQMINAGFNPLQVIAEKTGKSVADLKDDVSKGKITFDVLRDAMVSATSEGGKFFNLMEKQSQTTSGLISTLKDNFSAIQRELGQQLLPVINAVVKGMLANIDTIRKWITIIIDGIKNGLNPLWDIMSDIGSIFEDLNVIFGDSISFGDILSGIFKALGLVIKSVYFPVTLLIKGLSKTIELIRWAGEELGLITRDFEYFGERIKKDFGDATGFVKAFAQQTGGTQEQISAFVKTIDLNSVANMKYADGIKFLKEKWEEFIMPAENATQAIQETGAKAGFAAGSIKALEEQVSKLQKTFDETGSESVRQKLRPEIEFLQDRISQLTDGMQTFDTQINTTALGLVNLGATAFDQASRGLGSMADEIDVQEDKINKLAQAWALYSARLKEIAISVFPQLKQVAVDSIGAIAEGFGASLAGGEKFGNVLKKIGQELAVQIPKMLGFALLNAATTAQPWYLALALAASGATLVGLSGFIGEKIRQSQEDSGVDPAGLDGNVLTRNSPAGLSDFTAQQSQQVNLQGALDGAEITMRTEDGSFRATVEKTILKSRKLKGN